MMSIKARPFEGGARLATLFGTASVLALANAVDAFAQGEVVAQAEEIPETVLITGSLIRGTAAVGVPVTNLTPQDFAQTGALNTADLFRAFPAANVMPAGVATNSGATIERGVKVNIRGLDTGTATRSLLDGRRHPLPGPRQRPMHHRSLDHSGALPGPHRRPGGWRIGDLRLGRHLRRDQHHLEAQHGRRDHAGALDGRRRRQEPLPRVRGLGPHVGRRSGDAELRVVQRLAHGGEFPLPVRHRFQALGFRRQAPARIVHTGDSFDRPGAAARRRPHRNGRQYGQRLHELLRHSRSAPDRTGIPAPAASARLGLPPLPPWTGRISTTRAIRAPMG